MSHLDEKVRGEVWDAQIPVMFVLAASEVSTLHAPHPYYAMLPRIGYFASVCKRLQEHFVGSVVDADQQIWLEFSNQPIRWHLPVGVLFDSLNTSQAVPWTVVVHFRHFPLSLLNCSTVEKMEWVYINSVKEAMSLRHGSAKAVMGLSQESQTELFQGVIQHSFRKFWGVNQLLLDGDGANGLYRFVPVRFVFRNMQQPYVQKPIPPLDKDGNEHTLRSCLNILVPQLVASQQTQLSASPAPLSLLGDGNNNSNNSNNSNRSSNHDGEDSGVECMVHGQRVSLDTPLAWLVNYCAHADDFVYVVATINTTALVECMSGSFV